MLMNDYIHENKPDNNFPPNLHSYLANDTEKYYEDYLTYFKNYLTKYCAQWSCLSISELIERHDFCFAIDFIVCQCDIKKHNAFKTTTEFIKYVLNHAKIPHINPLFLSE